MKSIPLFLFFLVVAGELIAQITGTGWIHQLCKPLIMVFLGLHYVSGVSRHERSWLVISGVIFSFLGDTFLMYDTTHEMYFILGLGAFLGAHLFYLFAYREHSDRITKSSSQVSRVRLAFPVILAGTGLIAILFPVLGDLQIPVMVYALVLMAMVTSAIYRLGRTSFTSFSLVLFGAFLFMVSDSILAINKFLEPVPFGGFWIMLTYTGAQFLIITGVMKHHQSA